MHAQKDDGTQPETDINAGFGQSPLKNMAKLCRTAMQILQGSHARGPIALHPQHAYFLNIEGRDLLVE